MYSAFLPVDALDSPPTKRNKEDDCLSGLKEHDRRE
jgi:hypothetical protein